MREKKKQQTTILYPAKLSFKNGGKKRLSQTNKNWGNLLPVELLCQKKKTVINRNSLGKRKII